MDCGFLLGESATSPTHYHHIVEFNFVNRRDAAQEVISRAFYTSNTPQSLYHALVAEES